MLEQLRKAVKERRDDDAIAMLPHLKLALLAPQSTNDTATQREMLELAATLSLRDTDVDAFERYFTMLRALYDDKSLELTPSPQQYPLTGLNLLRLLAQNRIADFHAEIELIPADVQASNPYVRFPMQLEQQIMEGSYNILLTTERDGIFAVVGAYFMDMLVDTVRDEIADCSEKAYPSALASEMQRLLMLNSAEEFAEYAAGRGWKVADGRVAFETVAEPRNVMATQQLINDTLTYAKELERIV